MGNQFYSTTATGPWQLPQPFVQTPPEIGVAMLANAKQFTFTYPGNSRPLYYVVQLMGGGGLFRNGDTFEPFDVSQWAQYASDVEQIGGIDSDQFGYVVMNDDLPAGQGYYFSVYAQAGDAPDKAADSRISCVGVANWGVDKINDILELVQT